MSNENWSSSQITIKNIGQLATPAEDGSWELDIHDNAYIVIEDGVITDVGVGNPPSNSEDVLDAEGRAAIPAFVDPHTHAVFGGWRSREFELRLSGEDYKEILEGGGGILDTVSSTRNTDENELIELLKKRLDVILSCGVLTCEVKSGYGLDRHNELKMLRAIHKAASDHPIDVIPTFLGAHAVPKEWADDPDGYVEEEVIPLIAEVAADDLAQFVDVFCEPGAFTVQQSKKVLSAGKEAGLGLRIHADEMEPAGGTGLAAEMGCSSADHLLVAPEDELKRLAEAKTVAVLLPGTAFMLQEPYARARWMIDNGLQVALGSDFNPGSCPIVDIKFIMALACMNMSMTPAEVLVAVTRNAANSLDLDDRGVIAPGYRGDVLILDAPNYVHLLYRPSTPLIKDVISAGRLVLSNGG